MVNNLVDLVAVRATREAQREYHDRLRAASGRWNRRYASDDDHPDWSAPTWTARACDIGGAIIFVLCMAVLLLWR